MPTSKQLKLAKTVAAGIKGAVRTSGLPLKSVEGYSRFVTDNADVIEVMYSGVPPFMTMKFCINGEWTTYLGHPDTPNPTGENTKD